MDSDVMLASASAAAASAAWSAIVSELRRLRADPAQDKRNVSVPNRIQLRENREKSLCGENAWSKEQAKHSASSAKGANDKLEALFLILNEEVTKKRKSQRKSSRHK